MQKTAICVERDYEKSYTNMPILKISGGIKMQTCKCILCNRDAKRLAFPGVDGFKYECPNCGEFRVSDEFEDHDKDIHQKIDFPSLSGYVREQNELGNKKILITNSSVFDILKSSAIPQSVGEKLDKFILFMDRKTHYLSQPVVFDYTNEPAVCYADNSDELSAIWHSLRNNEYISQNGTMNNGLILTLKGIEYAEKLKHTDKASNSAFVAMWFSGEMVDIYEKAIKPAIESDEYGPFKAFRVDNHEYNNDITDEIIANIKAARFVVADMTGYRGGVYYEAGFARGLGKPVILTCRKDWFDGEIKDGNIIKEKIHFDINHLNIIVWETAEELERRLKARIAATII